MKECIEDEISKMVGVTDLVPEDVRAHFSPAAETALLGVLQKNKHKMFVDG